jgi:hypothetical protein
VGCQWQGGGETCLLSTYPAFDRNDDYAYLTSSPPPRLQQEWLAEMLEEFAGTLEQPAGRMAAGTGGLHKGAGSESASKEAKAAAKAARAATLRRGLEVRTGKECGRDLEKKAGTRQLRATSAVLSLLQDKRLYGEKTGGAAGSRSINDLGDGSSGGGTESEASDGEVSRPSRGSDDVRGAGRVNTGSRRRWLPLLLAGVEE